MPDLPIEIDCRTVQQKLRDDDQFVLLDCREEDEHALVHIAGARLLPMSQLAARVQELHGLQDRLITVHCHHGGRSLKVAHWLRAQGFANAQSMAGGIDEWSREIDSTLPRY